jgi:hypothetical protein
VRRAASSLSYRRWRIEKDNETEEGSWATGWARTVRDGLGRAADHWDKRLIP